MNWKDSIYSDGSKSYVSNPIPSLGDTITISLRLLEASPVKHILLRWKQDGLEHLKELEWIRSLNGLAYYGCNLQITSKVTNYHFYIVSGQEIYYYNQKGLFTYVPDEIYDFKIVADYEQCTWMKGMVFYQIFPDRFYQGEKNLWVENGEYSYMGKPVQRIKEWNAEPQEFKNAFCLDFYGGDLKGIEEKLPYLKKLGVNGIYLNPIFSSPTVHKYDCTDYFHVDKHLGGDLAFESLMKNVHEEEMRLVLDISINHTGMNHSWFNREAVFYDQSMGAFSSEDAKEREYYYFEKDGKYGCFEGIPLMPKLNYHSEELRRILYKDENSVLKKWLKDPYHIDGWRFDVAATTGQYKLDHFEKELWKEIRKEIKDTNPEAYILAEDWNDGYEFLQGDQWDGIMNFFGCGRPIRDYVGQLDFRHSRIKALSEVLPNNSGNALAERIMNFYGKLPFVLQEMQFNMLDCHDIGRLHNYEEISFAQYEMAVFLMYMLPGCVCMYYGDEIGLNGRTKSSEGCRYPMDWTVDFHENPYFHLYQTMNLEKQKSIALREGGFKILGKHDSIFACARFTEQEVYIVVTSMEKEDTKEVYLQLEIFGKNLSIGNKDILGKELNYIEKEGGVTLVVPPLTGYFFTCTMG